MARLNRKRPFGTYAAVSATTIARDLIARFAPGFTGVHVEAALPAVSVTFDGSDTLSGAFAKLAGLIGGYSYVEDLDVHLFLTEATSTPDDIDATPGRFLNTPPIVLQADDSQLRTRVIGKGAGSSLSADVGVGMTSLPISDAFTDNSAGSVLIGSAVIPFTGLASDDTGTVTTGPTAAPAAPTAAVSTTTSGGPLGAVAYYKTDVNDQGESEPSPVSNTVTPATVGTPGAISSGAVLHTAVGTYNATPKDLYTFTANIARTGSSFAFTDASGPRLTPGSRVRIFQSGTGAFDGVWTVASVSGTTVTVTGVSTSAPASDTAYFSFVTDGPLDGTYEYGVSFVSAIGETAISGVTAVTAVRHAGVQFTDSGTLAPQTGGGNMTPSVNYTYWTTVKSQNGETSPLICPLGGVASMGAGKTSVLITFHANKLRTAFEDLRVMSLGLYRSRANATTPFAVTTITREQLAQAGALDNSTNYTYTDTAADSSLTSLPSNDPIGAAIGLWGITTTSDARATGRRLWRKLGGVWYPLAVIGDRDVSNFYLDTTPDSELGQGALGLDPKPFGGAMVTVTVPVGASGTTSRKVYRTKAGPTAKAYFCGTVDANTLTAFEDKKIDADLGDEMPRFSRRRTLKGSTTLRVLDLATLLASGWARSGSQVFLFTGRSASSGEGLLTGIPATGAGSLTADISTDAEVIIEPHLTGVTALTAAIVKGTSLRLYTVRNDTAAQAALIALDAAQGRTSDGIVEAVVTEDLQRAELIARCDAELDRYSTPLVTVTFDARDPKLKSGKPITFNLTSPAIAETLTLMSVDISEIDVSRVGTLPRFHCVASKAVVSLDSILRTLLKKAG
jgi:hypothetical protein